MYSSAIIRINETNFWESCSRDTILGGRSMSGEMTQFCHGNGQRCLSNSAYTMSFVWPWCFVVSQSYRLMKWSNQGIFSLADIFTLFLGYVWINYVFVPNVLQNPDTELSYFQYWITLLLTDNHDYFDIIPVLLVVALTSMQFDLLFGIYSLDFEYLMWDKLLIMISIYYYHVIQIQWSFDPICLIMDDIKQKQHTIRACIVSKIIIVYHQCNMIWYVLAQLELNNAHQTKHINRWYMGQAFKQEIKLQIYISSIIEQLVVAPKLRKCASQTEIILTTDNLIIQTLCFSQNLINGRLETDNENVKIDKEIEYVEQLWFG